MNGTIECIRNKLTCGAHFDDRLKADTVRALTSGREAVKRLLSEFYEADDYWRTNGWTSERRSEGTNYLTPYIRQLEVWCRKHKVVRPRQGSAVGNIYFVRIEDVPNKVKIGFSTSVAKRVRTFRTGVPGKIETLLTMKGSMADEQMLHQRFAADRLQGEWFQFSHAIQQFISERGGK